MVTSAWELAAVDDSRMIAMSSTTRVSWTSWPSDVTGAHRAACSSQPSVRTRVLWASRSTWATWVQRASPGGGLTTCE